MQRDTKRWLVGRNGGQRFQFAVTLVACLALHMIGVASAFAQSNILAVDNDVVNSGSLLSTGVINLAGNNQAGRRVGSSGGANTGLVNIYFFELPDETELANDVSMEFSYWRLLGDAVDYNTDLYGLGYVSGTPTIATSWYYGQSGLDARTRSELGTGTTGTITRIFDNYLTPSSRLGRPVTGPNTDVRSFLQTLYADGAVAGDFAVIRLSADEIVDDNNLRPASTGYDLGISNASNRPYHPATLSFGTLPEVADSFGGANGLVNSAITVEYETGYGFVDNWQSPASPFAANAVIGRASAFSGIEPITVTTGLGDFEGGFTGARMTGDTGFINSPLRRELSTLASGEVYFRYLVRVETGFDSDDLIGFWLNDSVGGDEFDYTQDGVMLGIRNGGEIFASIDGTTTAVATTITEGDTNLVIGRLYESQAGSGLNRLDFWLNPDSEDESPLGTVSLGSNGFSAVTHVGFMTNATTELEDSYLFDALALSSSKERIGFINPEVTGLDGDFNLDGRVDAADYVVWRDEFGDTARYDLWRANFGAMQSAGIATSVPEPANMTLLLFGVGAMWIAKRHAPIRSIRK